MKGKKEKTLLSSEEKVLKRQKKTYFALCCVVIVIVGVAIKVMGSKPEPAAHDLFSTSSQMETASYQLDPENIRLSKVEWQQEEVEAMVKALLASQNEMKEAIEMIAQNSSQKVVEQGALFQLELEKVQHQLVEEEPIDSRCKEEPPVAIACLDSYEEEERSDVTAFIPAGTVVRCVLASAADCSVGVQQPKGPAKMLLRPLSNGQLPRKVRVALKDSVILASASGDLSNERVYVRADRMTLVQPNGEFVETEVSAYVSGEDGREGVRGIVVDRSGSIITRAAFASFLQGVSQSVQTTLNNQTIEKISKVGDNKTILDVDTFRNSGLQGTSTALNKLADYYIKRAEQLQPSIQVAAGRVVDLIFTHGVRIGEKDLRKKLEIERALAQGRKNG